MHIAGTAQVHSRSRGACRRQRVPRHLRWKVIAVSSYARPMQAIQVRVIPIVAVNYKAAGPIWGLETLLSSPFSFFFFPPVTNDPLSHPKGDINPSSPRVYDLHFCIVRTYPERNTGLCNSMQRESLYQGRGIYANRWNFLAGKVCGRNYIVNYLASTERGVSPAILTSK